MFERGKNPHNENGVYMVRFSEKMMMKGRYKYKGSSSSKGELLSIWGLCSIRKGACHLFA